MKPWEVYLASVPFEDKPGGKIRPVVIIEDRAILVHCIKMTGQAPRRGEYVLQRWQAAGLHKETVVRISKLLALPPDRFIKRLGVLDPVDIAEIQKLIK